MKLYFHVFAVRPFCSCWNCLENVFCQGMLFEMSLLLFPKKEIQKKTEKGKMCQTWLSVSLVFHPIHLLWWNQYYFKKKLFLKKNLNVGKNWLNFCFVFEHSANAFFKKNGRGSERRISLLRLAIFFRTLKMAFELITTTTS